METFLVKVLLSIEIWLRICAQNTLCMNWQQIIWGRYCRLDANILKNGVFPSNVHHIRVYHIRVYQPGEYLLTKLACCLSHALFVVKHTCGLKIRMSGFQAFDFSGRQECLVAENNWPDSPECETVDWEVLLKFDIWDDKVSHCDIFPITESQCCFDIHVLWPSLGSLKKKYQWVVCFVNQSQRGVHYDH